MRTRESVSSPAGTVVDAITVVLVLLAVCSTRWGGGDWFPFVAGWIWGTTCARAGARGAILVALALAGGVSIGFFGMIMTGGGR